MTGAEVGGLGCPGSPGGRTGTEGRGRTKGTCYPQILQGIGRGGWALENASPDVLCQIHWRVMGWNLVGGMSFLHLHSQHFPHLSHCPHLPNYLPPTQCHCLPNQLHCLNPEVQESDLDHRSSAKDSLLLQVRGAESHIQTLTRKPPLLRKIFLSPLSHHNPSHRQQCLNSGPGPGGN